MCKLADVVTGLLLCIRNVYIYSQNRNNWKVVRCLRGDEMRSRQTTKQINTLQSTTVTHACMFTHTHAWTCTNWVGWLVCGWIWVIWVCQITKNGINLELIEIFQFCLKIFELWRLLHPHAFPHTHQPTHVPS